jgi:hypothetical protein
MEQALLGQRSQLLNGNFTGISGHTHGRPTENSANPPDLHYATRRKPHSGCLCDPRLGAGVRCSVFCLALASNKEVPRARLQIDVVTLIRHSSCFATGTLASFARHHRFPAGVRSFTLSIFRQRQADFDPTVHGGEVAELHGCSVSRETLHPMIADQPAHRLASPHSRTALRPRLGHGSVDR